MNTDVFVSYRQPKLTREGVAGKLRPRIELPELAVFSSLSLEIAKRLRAFKRARHFSLISLP